MPLKAEGHIYQRSDHSRKCSSGVDAKYRDCNCDCQFKIIGGGGKSQCCRFGIIRAELFTHVKGDQKHQHEVKQQRDDDPQDIDVTGSKVKYNNTDAVMAGEIKKGDKTLTLWDEKGIQNGL
jgi:hypothetical protein